MKIPFSLVSLVLFVSLAFAKESELKDPLVIADFNSETKPNNIGQDWGSWYNPADPEQGTWETVEPDDYRDPQNGHCLKIDYDVQSPRAAFNGLWMKLGGLDASPYQWLSFYLRGASNGRFTKRFKIELKNREGQRAVYLVDQVSPEWQQIRIPFQKNTSVSDWKHLVEMVIVFDDLLATYKEGTLYFDQFQLEK